MHNVCVHAQLCFTQLMKTAVEKLTFNLLLEWKESINLSSGVSSPQVARIGSMLYISGVESECGVYKITELSLASGQCRTIETPVCWFGMATVNDQLIIAGGQSHEGESDKVWAMDTDKKTWEVSFTSMPTARESPSAIVYDRWMFVIGGWGSKCVEVLDTVSQLWYTTLPLPSQATRPSLTVLEHTLYIGWDNNVVFANIPALISYAVSNDQTSHLKWHQLPPTLTKNPAITSFHDILLAIGGEPPSSSIIIYLPVADKWIEVSKLPSPCKHCLCTFIPESGKLLIVGGRSERNLFIKSIQVCMLCNV